MEKKRFNMSGHRLQIGIQTLVPHHQEIPKPLVRMPEYIQEIDSITPNITGAPFAKKITNAIHRRTYKG